MRLWLNNPVSPESFWSLIMGIGVCGMLIKHE